MLFKKLIDFRKRNPFFLILTGLFSQLLFASFYALFLPIDAYFYLINFVIAATLNYNSYSLVSELVKGTIDSFRSFSLSTKLVFFLVVILTVLSASSVPFLADNESYYIQTIKWLNNYGLVKGLVNLHLFFGQSSGWHILQSTFNFSFFSFFGNDLNGFLLVGLSFYSAVKWHDYTSSFKVDDLYGALFFGCWIILNLFISAPSPDLPLMVILPLIVHLFIKSYSVPDQENVFLVMILSVLLVLIKVTIAPVLLLPLILIVRARSKQLVLNVFPIALLALVSFLARNFIISGYPFYPLTLGSELFEVDWKSSYSVHKLFFQLVQMKGFEFIYWEDFESINLLEKFLIWIQLPGIKGLMNKMILISLLIAPFFLYKRSETKWVLLFCVVQFVFFFISSPQYRFFLPVLLSIGMYVTAILFQRKRKILQLIVFLNLVVVSFLGIYGADFFFISKNRKMSKFEAFEFSQILIPKGNSQFTNITYSKVSTGNLDFYSPQVDSLSFWFTGDGPLPSVNQEMIDYFSQYYDHVPQLRSEHLKDGFRSSSSKLAD